jgi:phosphatidylglycerol:prolipoprotein diacylglycerol transferase
MLTYPNIDPVAISVGSLKVHWYGIMYLLAFAAAWLIAWKRAARPDSPLQRSQIEDLIVYGALGVVLGGRFGYVVLYNFETWMRDPLWLFRVWEGGMAFHGGLLGVILAIFFYCRRTKIPFSASLDFIAPLVPLGLGLGRLGNFIGQELWGRATDASWGMVFPRDPEQLVRHPSQLYQAFLEGVVLFLIVYWFSRKPRPRLAVGSVFLIFYGIFRFAIEFVRQPDDHIKTLIFGWMTRGQLLTIPMIVVGVAVLFWVYYLQKRDSQTKTPAATKNKKSKETQK